MSNTGYTLLCFSPATGKNLLLMAVEHCDLDSKPSQRR